MTLLTLGVVHILHCRRCPGQLDVVVRKFSPTAGPKQSHTLAENHSSLVVVLGGTALLLYDTGLSASFFADGAWNVVLQHGNTPLHPLFHTTPVAFTCQSVRSIEAGNQPTEVSIRSAKQANEAEGGVQALQDTIDALTGIPLENASDSGATGSTRTDGGEIGLDGRGKVGEDAGGNQHQETEGGEEEVTDDNVKNVEEANGSEGWGDGEGDDYSEEEYEDSDIDGNEEVVQEPKTEENRPLPAGGAAASATSDGVSPERDTSKNRNPERVDDGSSLECDSDGRAEDTSRVAGSGKSKSVGDEGDPGALVSDSAQKRANDAFATRHGSVNVSEVPVYLSGGKHVSADVYEGFFVSSDIHDAVHGYTIQHQVQY